MTMLKATAALSNLFYGGNVDPDKVTVIICADDPETGARIERALVSELNPLIFMDPVISRAPNVRAFKLHGVRVVVSDLTHEEPMYLITKSAPK